MAADDIILLIKCMGDWYRKRTWSKNDEDEFFAKLARARKDGRAQYLKIQAIELVETKDKSLLKTAEFLLNKVLEDYPEDIFNKSATLFTLGEIYKQESKFEIAMEYFKKALDFEKNHPNVRTKAFLEFSELVVRTAKKDMFAFVEGLLEENLPGQIFPLSKYRICSILAIINADKNNVEKARYYSGLASQFASAETSGLRYHKYLGLVKK